MSGKISDAELEDLKARNPCDQVAARWVTLRKHGKKMIGPCPMCSPDPQARDSTAFECSADSWVCAKCADGGDVIKLIARHESLDPKKDFRKVVEILGGTRAIDPEEAARAQAARDRIRAERERENQIFRDRELKTLFATWHNADELAGTIAERYLERRGLVIPPAKPSRMRYRRDHPFFAPDRSEIHRGPAMLAAIVNAEGKFRALHATWLDLDRANGKASIADPKTGATLPAKKVRGSKAGGRIELVPIADPKRLIIGEGIETVLSVYAALARSGRDLAGTAFWSAVDLGNLAGKAAGSVPHPTTRTETGRPARVPGPVPDREAPGLAIPESVDELVLLGDADSDRFTTECALVRAAARYARPGRSVRLAWAAPGRDFNDMLQAGDLAKILEAIDQAAVPIAPMAAEPRAPLSSAKKAVPKSSPKGKNGGEPPSKGGGGGDHSDGDDEGGGNDFLDRRLAFFPQTDLGNAERFRERYRGTIRWCQATGWLSWDGDRWAIDGADESVMRAEDLTVRAIKREAKSIKGTDRDRELERERGSGRAIMLSEKLERWARTSEGANKLSVISRRAKAYLAVAHRDLDADRFMINAKNGTIVVRRSREGDQITFKPHDPADLITKVMPVDYDPEATCPIYDKFIAQVQPAEPMRRFLHQWLGISLTGDTSEQRLVFNYGTGNNGKSTLLEIAAYVAGDYAAALPIETFLDQGKARSPGQATPDLALLPGVRLLRTSEPERGAKLAEAFVKLITGGDPIMARNLNTKYFQFVPQFKLTMSGNYKPDITGVDLGIWRRVLLIPWTVTVAKEDVDPELVNKMKAEGSGILNRLLDGLRDWLDNGLKPPQEALEATAEYRAESDPIGRFLEDCTEPDQVARVQTSALYELFGAWALANAERASTPQYFGRSLREHGLRSIKSNGVHWWLGRRATKLVSDFIDSDRKPLDMSERKPTPDAKGDDDEFTI